MVASRTGAETGNTNRSVHSTRGRMPARRPASRSKASHRKTLRPESAGPLEAITRPCSSSIQTARYSVIVATRIRKHEIGLAAELSGAHLLFGSPQEQGLDRASRPQNRELAPHDFSSVCRQQLLPQSGDRLKPFEESDPEESSCVAR